MKTLDFIKLSFPEMDLKKQAATVGGDNGYDPINGGQYGNGVTITAPAYHPPTYNPWPTYGPGFDPGSNGGGGGGGGTGSSGDPSYNTPTLGLHPETVDHLMATLKFGSNITDTQKEYFKKILGEIDKSVLGDKMLKAMDDAFKLHPEKIPTITDKAPTHNSSATAEYNGGTNPEFDLANFFQDGLEDSWQVYNLAHEMYHSYQDVTGFDRSSLNAELDAYMFGSKVVLESFPGDSYAQLLAKNNVEVANPTTPEQTKFNQAWDKFLNGDTSNENYKELIDNFHNGTNQGANYNGAVIGSGTPTIFQPASGSTGGSGSSGPSDPSGWGDGSGDSGYGGTGGYNR